MDGAEELEHRTETSIFRRKANSTLGDRKGREWLLWVSSDLCQEFEEVWWEASRLY